MKDSVEMKRPSPNVLSYMDLDSKKRRESRDGEVKEERGRRGKQGK